MTPSEAGRIYVVDDDQMVRRSLVQTLRDFGYDVVSFSSGTHFVDVVEELERGCVLLDVKMPGMNGLEVLKWLRDHDCGWAVVMISGHADVPMAVEAMRIGASDFIEKPWRNEEIAVTIRHALEHGAVRNEADNSNAHAQKLSANLTERESEVLDLLVQGHSNKVVARELNISPRTVEVHRARIMRRLGASNFAELVRMSVAQGL